MRPRWKTLAKRAYIAAFTLDQVSEALGPALSSDWDSEVSTPLVRALERVLVGDDPGTLFPDQVVADLQSLRSRCTSTMENSLVAAALDALADGYDGRAALEQAAEAALEARSLSCFRQVEEHVLRDRPQGRAAGVRRRLEDSLPGAPLKELARELLKGTRGPNTIGPGKRNGIDDGVAL
jgi:hypothetical protein